MPGPRTLWQHAGPPQGPPVGTQGPSVAVTPAHVAAPPRSTVGGQTDGQTLLTRTSTVGDGDGVHVQQAGMADVLQLMRRDYSGAVSAAAAAAVMPMKGGGAAGVVDMHGGGHAAAGAVMSCSPVPIGSAVSGSNTAPPAAAVGRPPQPPPLCISKRQERAMREGRLGDAHLQTTLPHAVGSTQHAQRDGVFGAAGGGGAATAAATRAAIGAALDSHAIHHTACPQLHHTAYPEDEDEHHDDDHVLWEDLQALQTWVAPPRGGTRHASTHQRTLHDLPTPLTLPTKPLRGGSMVAVTAAAASSSGAAAAAGAHTTHGPVACTAPPPTITTTTPNTTPIPSPRIILHVDCDCFYVACERMDNAGLVGTPVAVEQFNKGGFVSVSYEVCVCVCVCLCVCAYVCASDFCIYIVVV